MDSSKIHKFMKLAGQPTAKSFTEGSPEIRKLGAQLLLSELLEYIIHGLGVIPEVNGVKISEPEKVTYLAENSPDALEMLDGLADVAYTMYWNACAFGLPLEDAFKLVCNNNLEKFVRLERGKYKEGPLSKDRWDCGANISWPAEVVLVEVLEVDGEFFAVGKDSRGKVRKPSSYKSVQLEHLIRSF